MGERSLDESLNMLHDLADAARPIALRHFHHGCSVEIKPDQTPVSQADIDIEQTLCDAISRRFIRDGILGEESPQQHGLSGRTWIIDPIDGTQSFICGVPLFGTLLAVMDDDTRQILAGVADFPALGLRISAATGRGAWHGRDGASILPARVGSCQRLSDALVVTTSIDYFAKASCLEQHERIRQACRSIRGWSDCYGLYLGAIGKVDAVLEPVMKPWDHGPFPVIYQEAGGRYANWEPQSASEDPSHVQGAQSAARQPSVKSSRDAVRFFMEDPTAVAGNATLVEQLQHLLRAESA